LDFLADGGEVVEAVAELKERRFVTAFIVGA
jgi:hypothetical protein